MRATSMMVAVSGGGWNCLCMNVTVCWRCLRRTSTPRPGAQARGPGCRKCTACGGRTPTPARGTPRCSSAPALRHEGRAAHSTNAAVRTLAEARRVDGIALKVRQLEERLLGQAAARAVRCRECTRRSAPGHVLRALHRLQAELAGQVLALGVPQELRRNKRPLPQHGCALRHVLRRHQAAAFVAQVCNHVQRHLRGLCAGAETRRYFLVCSHTWFSFLAWSSLACCVWQLRPHQQFARFLTSSAARGHGMPPSQRDLAARRRGSRRGTGTQGP